MNHRIGQYVFATIIGLLVALFSYRWITDPSGREAHARELLVVESSRRHLAIVTGSESLEIVDPLARDRKVGKAYVYPEDQTWIVSGFYRRGESDLWHPYLMSMNADLELTLLKTSDDDPAVVERAKTDTKVELVN